MLLGAIVLVVIGPLGLFVILQGAEPQDVILRGNTETTEHYLDGKLVGKGLLICVPKVSQGKHTIEQRGAGQTRTVKTEVGDVGITIVESTPPSENVITLSNCSGNSLVQ